MEGVVGLACAEVQQKLKWRKGVTPVFSVEDTKEWQARVRVFMKRPVAGETIAQKRKRLKFAHATAPRAATFNWLRDVSNLMACGPSRRRACVLGRRSLGFPLGRRGRPLGGAFQGSLGFCWLFMSFCLLF